ncbi:MAG: hypothetical protein GY757_32260 [bacterium]|nr:hypothetical protein [bacterium]
MNWIGQNKRERVESQSLYLAREALYKGMTEAIKTAPNVRIRNRLYVKLQIYQNLAKKAGKVTWLSKNRGGYPLKKTRHDKKKIAAKLADKLGAEFSDIAFLKRKIGNYGLKSMLKKMTWLENIPQLIEEVFGK